jgi:transcriptional repressor NrdR
MVRKRDGRVEAFSADKVRAGVSKAVADREVAPGAIDDLVRHVQLQVAEGGPEVSTEEIGRLVLEALREVDEVAYLRFVSVYKEFAGADDFEREMAALEGGEPPSG